MFTEEEIALAKPVYQAIKKISKGKWEWGPEVGEWCLWKGGAYRGQTQLIINIVKVIEIDEEKYVRFVDKTKWEEAEDFIPLLHWERIEEILEGMGYWIQIKQYSSGYCVNIWKGVRPLGDGMVIQDVCYETRQLAVMRAVIELAKEV